MAKYFLTNRAVEDLEEIWDYTFGFWSEEQADRYYKYLIDTCHEISKNPTLGKNYLEVREEILGFKMIKHIIFYRIIGPNDIEVIRILHEKMDLKSRLDE